MSEFSADFYPIFCYDFLPLDKKEEELRGGLAMPIRPSLSDFKRQKNTIDLAESYDNLANMAD